MKSVVYALLVASVKSQLQDYVECDSIGGGNDETNQYEESQYLEACGTDVTQDTCVAAAAAISDQTGKKACVTWYAGCGDFGSADSKECYYHIQTPDAGAEAADWEPRTCITDSDVEITLPTEYFAGIITFADLADDAVWGEDLEGCVNPERVVEEEVVEEEEDEEDEEEGAASNSVAFATLAVATALMA